MIKTEEIHENNRSEEYILKLQEWFLLFEKFMKDSNSEKKECNDERKVDIISSQIKEIKNTIEHSLCYREYFLKRVYSELDFQITKKSTIARIHHYLIDNQRSKYISAEKRHNKLSLEYKEEVRDINIHIDSFIMVLKDIKSLLENQLKSIDELGEIEKDEKEMPDNDLLIFLNEIKKKKHNLFLKFEKLLLEEEKLFWSFLWTLDISDLWQISKYEKFLIKKWITQSSLKLWITLTAIPESPLTDITSTAVYTTSILSYLSYYKSDFNEEEFYKYKK